jgi:glucose dehydrogenase
MAVEDDLRRLTQVDSIYLGYSVSNLGNPFTSWFKGRLQQANDGSWIVRSVSPDGTVSGFQLGSVMQNWQSNETPNTGIAVSIPINLDVPTQANPVQITTGVIVLRQQLPQELTN